MATYKAMDTTMTSHEKTMSAVVTVVAVFVVAYVIEKFFNFIFAPLYNTNSGAVQEMIERKQGARRSYLKAIADNAKDPMYQFQLRFLEKPEEYKGNPDNAVYLTWFNSWKKGLVIDSAMRWVPEVYDAEGNFNKSFQDYMKIQWNLHRKTSMVNRMKFLNTIRAYFPEFSSSFKGLEQDLARYTAMVTEENLEKDLKNELEKLGLPEGLAEYLIGKDLSSKELQRQAKYLKECVEAGCNFDVSTCALENKLTIEEAKVLNSFTNFPSQVSLAILKGELTVDDIHKLIRIAKRADDYDECVEETTAELERIKVRNRAIKYA